MIQKASKRRHSKTQLRSVLVELQRSVLTFWVPFPKEDISVDIRSSVDLRVEAFFKKKNTQGIMRNRDLELTIEL